MIDRHIGPHEILADLQHPDAEQARQGIGMHFGEWPGVTGRYPDAQDRMLKTGGSFTGRSCGSGITAYTARDCVDLAVTVGVRSFRTASGLQTAGG